MLSQEIHDIMDNKINAKDNFSATILLFESCLISRNMSIYYCGSKPGRPRKTRQLRTTVGLHVNGTPFCKPSLVAMTCLFIVKRRQGDSQKTTIIVVTLSSRHYKNNSEKTWLCSREIWTYSEKRSINSNNVVVALYIVTCRVDFGVQIIL